MYVINSKDCKHQGDAIHTPRDYIRFTAITYQSFGLYKNKASAIAGALFFGASSRTRTYDNDGQKYGRFASLFTRNSPYFFPFRPPCVVHRTRSDSMQLTAVDCQL